MVQSPKFCNVHTFDFNNEKSNLSKESKINNLLFSLPNINSFKVFLWFLSITATIIPTSALIAAFTPLAESSKTMHSFGSNPNSFAAKINMSGEGFPFFILLSSPVITISISSFNQSFKRFVLFSKSDFDELA